MGIKRRLMNDVSHNIAAKTSQYVSSDFASGVADALQSSVRPTGNLRRKANNAVGKVIEGGITAMRYQQAMRRLQKHMPSNTDNNGPSGPTYS